MLLINPFYAQPFYDHTNDVIAFYLERGGEVVAALLVSISLDAVCGLRKVIFEVVAYTT